MTRSRCLLLIAAASCARGGAGVDPDPDAATSIDAAPDACTVKTFYRDLDGDGHGDVTKPVQGCDPPMGAVMSSDDCDDGNAQRHPAHPELCDAIDNDCNAATAESCPTGCAPTRRPPPLNARAYLVCNISTAWANASAICAGAMYKLVQIDDEEENVYVRSAGNAGFGTGIEFHLGANDIATEGAWVWEGGVQFWQGVAAPSGMPVNSKYSKWDPSEPNNSSNAEDCAHMKPDGQWNDIGCGTALPFICRR